MSWQKGTFCVVICLSSYICEPVATHNVTHFLRKGTQNSPAHILPLSYRQDKFQCQLSTCAPVSDIKFPFPDLRPLFLHAFMLSRISASMISSLSCKMYEL